MSTGRWHDDPLIDNAIERIRTTHPYYVLGITQLRIVADDSVPTMATSASWVTHYNPETVKSWTPTERAAVLVHELEHLLRDHSGRMGDRDPKGWNIAGDAEINQRLDGLPDGAVYPETLGMPRGRVAEIYYAVSRQGNDNSEDPGDGAPGDSGDASGAPGDGTAQCGSSAGGPTQDHEKGDAANPGPGARGGGQETRKDTAKQVLASRLPGTAEGNDLRDWAEHELNIDRSAWYHALSSAVGHVMAPYGAPTRWRWPGRRDPRDLGGAMVPRWVGERPSCAVVIDTSSSITPLDLEMATAAGQFIARVADVTFYACDTRSYRLGSQMPETLPGGGGTDLRIGIAMAIDDGARAVVVITDCGTDWPREETPVPVIIGANPGATELLSGQYGGYYIPPEWMTVLSIVQE